MGSEMEKDKERNIIFKIENHKLLKSYLFPFAISEHMIPKQPKGKNMEEYLCDIIIQGEV